MIGDQETTRAMALEKRRLYRARKHAERYGPDAGNMRGRHGNNRKGTDHPKWKGGRYITSHGYVAVRVPTDHPHAWGSHPTIKYAYEHILVAEAALGRSLAANEVVHHKNEDKTDNRWGDNLEALTVTDHMKEHAVRRGRDELGRFPPADQSVHGL